MIYQCFKITKCYVMMPVESPYLSCLFLRRIRVCYLGLSVSQHSHVVSVLEMAYIQRGI